MHGQSGSLGVWLHPLGHCQPIRLGATSPNVKLTKPLPHIVHRYSILSRSYIHMSISDLAWICVTNARLTFMAATAAPNHNGSTPLKPHPLGTALLEDALSSCEARLTDFTSRARAFFYPVSARGALKPRGRAGCSPNLHERHVFGPLSPQTRCSFTWLAMESVVCKSPWRVSEQLSPSGWQHTQLIADLCLGYGNYFRRKEHTPFCTSNRHLVIWCRHLAIDFFTFVLILNRAAILNNWTLVWHDATTVRLGSCHRQRAFSFNNAENPAEIESPLSNIWLKSNSGALCQTNVQLSTMTAHIAGVLGWRNHLRHAELKWNFNFEFYLWPRITPDRRCLP